VNTLTVLGEAHADLLPDRVEWTLHVHEVDQDPQAAFDRCAERLATLAEGLASTEVTTSQIEVGHEYDPRHNRHTGRREANGALISTAPIERAAEIATIAMAQGADSLRGPRLHYPDATAAQTALLPQAVEAARRDADALAQAAGRRAGRVLEIRDPRARPDDDRVEYLRASATSGGGHDLPVIAEPRRLTATLIVTIELVD
jgi:uncharacterized protein YggE